jgi:hypothetical protein
VQGGGAEQDVRQQEDDLQEGLREEVRLPAELVDHGPGGVPAEEGQQRS